jgi:cytochrome c biogenesis protein CcmG, thiol:disulfide interchange protein DsbE
MASMKPKKSSLPPPKAKPRQSITVGKQRELNGRIIIGVVLAAVVILGVVIAVLVGGGDDDDEPTAGGSVPVAQCSAEDSTGDTTDEGSEGTVGEFADGEIAQPVAVEGDPLDGFSQPMIQGETADTALCARAPIVSGYNYDGDPVTIDAATDGPTMVVLLAHWCPHCNAEIPRLNEWRDAGNFPDGLNVVGVSTGIDPNRPNYPPAEWLVETDWQWPVLADSAEMTAFRAYGGEYFPTVVIIGSDGRVLLRFSGEPSVAEIDTLVRSALAADSAA